MFERQSAPFAPTKPFAETLRSVQRLRQWLAACGRQGDHSIKTLRMLFSNAPLAEPAAPRPPSGVIAPAGKARGWHSVVLQLRVPPVVGDTAELVVEPARSANVDVAGSSAWSMRRVAS